MRKIFLWFYCLPIADAVLLILLATVLLLFLREKFGNSACWKAGISFLLLVWTAVMLFGTLGQRTENGNLSEPILTPFASYYSALNGGNREIYRTNFMNVVLFYPAGLLGIGALPKRWKIFRNVVLITALFALMSMGIEYMQYRFGLGLAEVDDVIHNILGTLLGAIASTASIRIHKK